MVSTRFAIRHSTGSPSRFAKSHWRRSESHGPFIRIADFFLVGIFYSVTALRSAESFAGSGFSLAIFRSLVTAAAFALRERLHLDLVASYSIISIGNANSATITPREVFQRAVLVGAISVVLAHNHPSGSLEPSQQDREVTQRMRQAGDIMGISILDHLIVTDQSFLSLRDGTSDW